MKKLLMILALAGCGMLVASPASAQAMLTGEQTTGSVKTCYYSYLGQNYVYSVAS